MKKKKVLIINIPEPCHENWEEMTQVDKGRHCKVCDKCVIDFSNFSAQDLIQYFQNKPVNVCGRFHNFQLGLNQFEMLPVRNRSSWPLVASLFFLGANPVFSQGGKLSYRKTAQYDQLIGKGSNHHSSLPEGSFFIYFKISKIAFMDSLGIINEYTGKKNFVKADSMGVYKLQVDSTDVKADALRIYRQHDGKMVDSFFMSKIELEQAKNDVFEIAGSILPEIQINSAKPIHTSNFIATGRTETGILSVVNHLQRIQSPYPQNPISNPITEPYPNAKIPLKQSPKVEFGTYDSPGIDPNPRERR